MGISEHRFQLSFKNKKLIFVVHASGPQAEDRRYVLAGILTESHRLVLGIVDDSLEGQAYRVFPYDNDFRKKRLSEIFHSFYEEIGSLSHRHHPRRNQKLSKSIPQLWSRVLPVLAAGMRICSGENTYEIVALKTVCE